MLIFSFLRCPHLLTEEMKTWKSMTGFPVYTDLRKMLRSMPKTEREVAELAKEIDDYYRKVTKSLDDLTDDDAKSMAGGGSGTEGSDSGDSGASESTEPTKREIMEAMQKIRKHHKQRHEDGLDSDAVEEATRKEKKESGSIGERDRDSVERDGGEDKAESRAKKHRKEADKIAEDREGRFGELEIARMLRRFGTVTEGLDLSESDAIASF